jgi:hypothetical protein
MNSRQNIAWGLTKAAGMLLLWNALNSFFTILQNTLMATAANQGRLLSEASGLMSGWVAEGFICGVLGIYLLVSGRILMRLMGQDPE